MIFFNHRCNSSFIRFESTYLNKFLLRKTERMEIVRDKNMHQTQHLIWLYLDFNLYSLKAQLKHFSSVCKMGH